MMPATSNPLATANDLDAENADRTFLSRPLLLLLAFSTLVALWPTWRWFSLRFNDGGDEPFGLIPLLLCVGLAWNERASLSLSPMRMVIAGGLLLIYGLTMDALPVLIRSVAGIAALTVLTGAHRRPALVALALLALPISASLQFYFGYPMRVAAAEIAVGSLELVGIEVVRLGTMLDWRDMTVGVDPACSGLRMLWFCWVAAATACAFANCRVYGLVGVLIWASVACIFANGIRAALLFFPESGKVTLPAWAHDGIGIACFAFALISILGVIRFTKRGKTVASRSHTIAGRDLVLFSLLACSIGVIQVAGDSSSRHGHPIHRHSETNWPLELNGEPLIPIKPTPLEQQFSEKFPGAIGTFRCQQDLVILRHITCATRMLHPAADCLRGAGYSISESKIETDPNGLQWKVTLALSPDGKRIIARERITSKDGTSWADVTAWYWSALMSSDSGPWYSITRISKRD